VVLASTFAATLVLDLEYAMLAGVAASLIFYLNRTSHPSLRALVPNPRHPERKMTEVRSEPECPQMKILRIEGSIYFGACNHVEQHFDMLRRQHPQQKHLLLMSKSINFVDMAGADLIGREARKRNAMGGGVYLYSPREPVEALLHRGGYMADIGKDHVFRSKDEAFAGVFARLDRPVCMRCTARIFLECRTVPGPV
jgi:SulP family sulfate permease